MKSMILDKKLINAVGGKSARACDNCIKKRARWYCAADDAFLCQSCDSSVHSANPLARRHERVRLKTTSLFNSIDDESSSRSSLQISVPTWHQGFTKKARTPRQKKSACKFSRVNIPVPEIGCEEYSGQEENDDHDQLLYRVPIFDPFVAELCNSSNDNQDGEKELFHRVETGSNFGVEVKTTTSFQGFLPSEMDLAEFAADVESLLGKGLEVESFDMEGLGILGCDFNNDNKQPGIDDCPNSYTERVKVEEEETVSQEIRRNDLEIDLGRESFELNFDYEDSPIPCEEEEDEEDCKHQIKGADLTLGEHAGKTLLNLNYEGVLSSWGDEKSPWTTGDRPDFNSGDIWISTPGMGVYGETGMMNGSGGGAATLADGDREARVSRYREKRRTRLFAKKIRYEVRKLNAEKRPRMKGRFVKRAAVPAAAASLPLVNNK